MHLLWIEYSYFLLFDYISTPIMTSRLIGKIIFVLKQSASTQISAKTILLIQNSTL